MLGRAGFALMGALVLVWVLAPVWYMVVSSLANDQTQFQVGLWPQAFDLSNYREVLGQGFFLHAMGNSLVVAIAVVVASLALSVTAAYALARVRFAGRGLLLLTILGVSMFPQVAILAGMFELVRVTGLYNTLGAMIVAQTAFTLPFTVWLLTVFLRDLPVEIEEAAIIDGATPLVLIWKIFLPLLMPAIVTTGLLAFIGSWNEFLFALTLTISADMRTAPVAMSMISPTDWGQAAAASVLVTAPVAFIALVFQRRILAGLASTTRAG